MTYYSNYINVCRFYMKNMLAEPLNTLSYIFFVVLVVLFCFVLFCFFHIFRFEDAETNPMGPLHPKLSAFQIK